MEVAPRPKKILFVVTKAAWGGAQRYVFDLAEAAETEGHEVLVITGTEGPLTERLRDSGIRYKSIESMTRDVGLRKELAAFRELLGHIRTFKPDVVHANSSKAGGLSAVAARLAGVRQTVFTAHGWAFNELRPRWQKCVIWFFHYLTILSTDTVICVSDAIRKDVRNMPFVSHKFVVIKNGADATTLVPKTEARQALAPGREESLWIGSIAELHPTKNLVVAIEAFARIKDDFPDALFVIMGEGNERERLENSINARQLHERVRLVGHVTNAPSYLSALDVFVLPSRSEALGYVILEAGHAHLPVLASRVGGIPEIIRAGKDGMLVAPTDIVGFAAGMRELLSDAHKRRALGASLAKRVEEDFPKARMVAQTLALYT